jgi:hypothetical protein
MTCGRCGSESEGLHGFDQSPQRLRVRHVVLLPDDPEGAFRQTKVSGEPGSTVQRS